MKIKLFAILLSAASLWTAPARSQDRIVSHGSIPTLAWYSIPPEQATVERYRELKNDGFSISLTLLTPSTDALIKALDNAQKAGVQLLVYCPELKSDPEATVKRIMHHPALFGYFLQDEPTTRNFADLAAWSKRILAVDSKHPRYINLDPNYAQLKVLDALSYRDYVERFNREVSVEFLSFDFYPIVGDDIRPQWYDNLETISDIARQSGKPFWAFALSTPHFSYAIPTLANLRLQVYSDLAYGAQGIQYFTYWSLNNDAEHAGPVEDGRRSAIYDRVRQVNAEIQALSGVFLGAKVLSVQHSGDIIPQGTKPLTDLPAPIKSLTTKGAGTKGAIVSVLENGGNRFLVVVNRDIKEQMELIIHTAPEVKRVLKDGSLVPQSSYLDTLFVDPGDVMIWTWPASSTLTNPGTMH